MGHRIILRVNVYQAFRLRTVNAMLAMVSYISKYGRFVKFLLNLKIHKYLRQIPLR